MIEDLKKFKKERSLVSIRRKDLITEAFLGFILGFSDDLIFLQYVYDFNLDGFKVIRRSDIEEIKSDEADIFYTQMMKDDGLYQKIDFSRDYDVKDWNTVLSTIAKYYKFVIIEDEIDENKNSFLFVIGKVQKIKKNGVSILGFSGDAEWHDSPTDIEYEKITCITMGSDYANAYERYFQRNS